MIMVGSVRPGRVGLPVAEWVRQVVADDGRFEIDWADLAEIALPFMDEPAHPSKREYTQPHTFAWSERVDAADAYVFVLPEYNHSFAPSVKNAIDYLAQEWWRKPWTSVTYGGVSGGTRGAAALTDVVTTLGMVRTVASVEINAPRDHVVDGTFTPDDRVATRLLAALDELAELVPLLAGLRAKR